MFLCVLCLFVSNLCVGLQYYFYGWIFYLNQSVFVWGSSIHLSIFLLRKIICSTVLKLRRFHVLLSPALENILSQGD